MNNSMSIKDKLKNISKNKNIDFNLLLRDYMYERFIERLANSKYKENFILKGGFFLSTLFGLDKRTTMDIDLSLKNETLSKDNLVKIINEIINIRLNDNVIITFDEISNIRDEDIYGGYRIKITVKLDNIKESFNIDVATGDPITPREMIYKYITLLDYECIDLYSYNLETILAEKLETILTRRELSSRMKDYYDIYLIYVIYNDKINLDILRQAINNTFIKRKVKYNINDAFIIIKDNNILKNRWLSYSKRNKFAKDISFEDIIICIEKIINIIIPVENM